MTSLTSDTHRELVDYYKWVVTLVVFMLSISIGSSDRLRYGEISDTVTRISWVCFALNIIFNWLIVKGFATMSVVSDIRVSELDQLQLKCIDSLPRIKTYANIQHGLFLAGIIFLVLGALL